MIYDPKKHIETIKMDLLQKFYRNDFHGVADGAMDLREIIAYIKGLEKEEHP